MIVLIDNYDSFTFNLVHYLGGLGAEVVVHRNDKIAVEDVIAGGGLFTFCSNGSGGGNFAVIKLNAIGGTESWRRILTDPALPPNATCSGGPAGTGTALYDSSNGTGQLAFSYDMPNNRFVFNWDTTGLSAGCYNLVVTPDDATANNTLVHLQ